MHTIKVPYCAGNFSKLSFKEISPNDYNRFISAIEKMKLIRQEKFYSSDYVNSGQITATYQEQHRQLAPRYDYAVKRLAEIKKQHRKVLARTKELEDSDFSIPLSWIIFGITRYDALEKHKKKHAHIYNEMERLWDIIKKSEPYSSENIQQTIKEAIKSAESKKKYENEIKRRDWERKQEKKRSEQQAILRELLGYTHIIKDFTITTEGTVCKIKGILVSVYDGATENLNQTLFNKSISITR